jgi:hypothetical protein
VTAFPVLNVTPNTQTIVVGDNLQFYVSGSTTPPLTWGVTNMGVASISGTGLLTATAKGQTRVFVVDDVGGTDTTDAITICDLRPLRDRADAEPVAHAEGRAHLPRPQRDRDGHLWLRAAPVLRPRQGGRDGREHHRLLDRALGHAGLQRRHLRPGDRRARRGDAALRLAPARQRYVSGKILARSS